MINDKKINKIIPINTEICNYKIDKLYIFELYEKNPLL